MAKNVISLELCAEDRARLDRINNTLEKLVAQGLPVYVDPEKATSPAPAPEEPTPVVAEAHPVEEPFQEIDVPDSELPWSTPEAPTYKLSDIQQKVVQLSAAGKKAQVRDIVKAYAEKVSAIPEDKFGEVMAKLAGLES